MYKIMRKNVGKTKFPKRKSPKKSNKVFTKGKTTLNKTIKTAIKKEISKNIENKYTQTINYANAIITSNASAIYSYFTYNISLTGALFQLSQGTSQDERVGNKIKLKRWIVKGIVFPNFNATVIGSQQGYATVYFGRRIDTLPITATLPDFYQDGSTNLTPVGMLRERLMAVNNDVYKIYWKKVFKVGLSQPLNNPSASAGFANNDFDSARTFGFDVCKLCVKNRVLKYDDNSVDMTDPIVDSLTMFATFNNANSDIPTGVNSGASFYSIQLVSYAEYEDA